MDVSMISKNCKVATSADTGPLNAVGFVYPAGTTCSIVTADGDTVNLSSAFAGIVHPQAIRKINWGGSTTATEVLIYRG